MFPRPNRAKTAIVNDTKNSGAIAVWYQEIKNARDGRFPHLSVGALIVTAIVGSVFAVLVADALAIMVGHGPHAFFVEHLRITDWKHSSLSNGGYLSFLGRLVQVPATLALMAAMIFGADFVAMRLQLLTRNTPRLKMLLHLLGGAGLLLFAISYYRRGHLLLHPVPLSALIGGAVLIWKTITAAIRHTSAHQPQ